MVRTPRPRVALVHANPLAMAPIADAFRRLWPEAETFDLLDDALMTDLERAGGAAAGFAGRLGRLAEYALGAGAQAILFTCSAFGPAIEACRAHLPVPVLKPNEGMIEEALDVGTRVALVATFEPALAPIAAELRDAAAARHVSIDLRPVHVEGALEALRRGDVRAHDDLLANAAAALGDRDVICFAQFSMTSAAEPTARAAGRPVLTTPDGAVKLLRHRMAAP